MKIGKLRKVGIPLLTLVMMLGLVVQNNIVDAAQTYRLTEATTEDTSNIIDMTMFKYTDSSDSQDTSVLLGRYGNGEVKQGLVKKVLDKTTGLPVTTNYYDSGLNKRQTSGIVLDKYFSTDSWYVEKHQSVNKLFLSSIYNETGYYEYSSFENYAYLNNNGNFTVYDQLGTPSNWQQGINKAYYRGNFFPYNTITNGIYSNLTNEYDENGGDLPNGHPRKGERLYLTNGATYHFGMLLEATFAQPENGQVTHNGSTSDMIYTFNGDDDLWLFIDNVLVLDIGGIHDAHSGTINFRTGEIVVHTTTSETVRTNIKECFRQAGIFPDGTDWEENKANMYFDGNTFADFTPHTMKMFYMERGGGCSNLHMKFNLQLIPEGQIQIGKQLDSGTDPVVYGDVEFGFKLELQNDTGGYNQVTRSDVEKYGIYKRKINSEVNESLSWSDDGRIFYLKPNEIAYFNNLDKEKKYKITEVDVKSDEFDQVTIQGTSIKIQGKDDQVYDATSGELSIAYNSLAMFINRVNADNKRTLYIEKDITEGQVTDDNETFKMLVQFKNAEGEYVNYSGGYTVFEGNQQISSSTTDNGIITLEVGQHACIYNILSGTEFKVEERDLNTDKYNNPSYSVKTQDKYSKGSTGTVELKYDSYVNVVNDIKRFDLTVHKYVKDINFEDGDPIFTFQIKCPNGEYIYKTVRFDDSLEKENGLYHLSFTLPDMQYGNYEIVELDTIRYDTCDSNFENTVNSKQQIVLSADDNVRYYNKLTYDDNFSHTDVVTNEFSVNENGEITITPNDQKTVTEGAE